MKNVIGFVNFHSAPYVPPLVDHRSLGSTSFLGRFALCDFALSNLCNSEISQVGLLIKEHQRSILKHLGSMDYWLTNTKIGRTRVLYNEDAHFHPETNTDMNNIRVNDWFIYESTATQMVIVPSHLIIKIDLRPYIKLHNAHQNKATIVCHKIADASKEFLGAYLLDLDEDGTIKGFRKNDGGNVGPAIVSLGIHVINRATLSDIVHDPKAIRANMDIEGQMLQTAVIEKAGFEVVYYDGFVRSIDTFKHYMDYCLAFLDKKNASEIFDGDWPIYTLTHDTIPALYGAGAVVQNSYVSNGAIVEGTVINSIIARDVRIAKGAVVRDSIVFSSSRIGEGAKVSHALLDKGTIILGGHVLKGSKNEPVYIAQGATL